MVTPLKKHRGQHGGLIALAVLVASSVVVWATHPRAPAAPVATSANANEAPARAPRPIAPAAILPSAPERPPVVSFERGRMKTMVVGERELRRRVTASGYATFDERRTSHVSAPVHGWLQKQRASSLGRRVRQGEVLGVVYSAEVYLATAELVAQVRAFHSQELVDKQRWQLLRWGMPRPMIERIENTLKPTAALPLVARLPGTVVAEQGLPRQLVEPSQLELFTITEPANVWAFVEVPEADMALVRVGTPAKLTVEGVARPQLATVAYIYRRGEAGMRTVRFDVYSPQVAIAPTARVHAELDLGRERGPAIPESAVIQMGTRTFVYVVRGTALEPRDVKLGTRGAGFYLVESGLAVGETIALHRPAR